MIRFKVMRASRILLVFSIIVLLSVVAVLLFRSELFSKNSSTAASLVMADTAEAKQVFAVSRSSGAISFDPGQSDGFSVNILTEKQDTAHAVETKRILIYHTHTHEAYSQNDASPYKAIEAWRTTDSDHSVVRVGSELAARLMEMGFNVVHDTTDHEASDLSTAYDRSLIMLESYQEPFDLRIDLHRDAYSEGLQLNHKLKNGGTSAQIMLLIGNGEGFDIKTAFEENRIFAKKLTQRINRIEPGICRDVLVKNGRYNQHTGLFSVLIEVGHNMNTLNEALNAVEPLAQGIYDIFAADPDIQVESILKEQSHGMD